MHCTLTTRSSWKCMSAFATQPCLPCFEVEAPVAPAPPPPPLSTAAVAAAAQEAADAAASSTPAPAAGEDGPITLRARRLLVAQRVAAERARAKQQKAALVDGLGAFSRALPRGTVLPERVRQLQALPSWIQRVPPSHDLIWGGGLLGCRRCGAIIPSFDARTLLSKECRGTCPAGSRSRIDRFLSGSLPQPFQTWPDGGRDSSDLVAVAQLGFGGNPPAWRYASA